MSKTGEDWRPDFEQAVGEAFGESVSPPVPFEDASPHECCEVVWSVVGSNSTPTRLAGLTEDQLSTLAQSVGEVFGCDQPTVAQVKRAIAYALKRWPVGSLGEPPEDL